MKIARQSRVDKISSFKRRGLSFNFLKIKQNLRSWGFRKNPYSKPQSYLPLTKRPNNNTLSHVRNFYRIPGFLKTSNVFITTPRKGSAASFFFRFQSKCPRALTSPENLSLLTPCRPVLRSHFSVNQHWFGASLQPLNLNIQNLNSPASCFAPVFNLFYQIHSGYELKPYSLVSDYLGASTVRRTLAIQLALLLPFLHEKPLNSLFLRETYLLQRKFLPSERQHFYTYSNRKLYRWSLRYINLSNKRVNRKFRTFATHLIKPHLHDNLVWGEVIPELPLALRGSFSSNKSSLIGVSAPYLHSFPSKSVVNELGTSPLVRNLSLGLRTTPRQLSSPKLNLPQPNTRRLLTNLTSRLRKLARRLTTLKLRGIATKRVYNKTSLFLIRRLKRRFRRMKFSRRSAKVLLSPSSRQLTPYFKLWLKSNLTSLRYGNYATQRRKVTSNQLLTRKVSQALKGPRRTLLFKSKINWTISPIISRSASSSTGKSLGMKQLNSTPTKLLTPSPFNSSSSLFLTSHVNFWTNPTLLKYYLWRASITRLGPSSRSVPNIHELISWVKRAQHSLATLSFENQLSNIRSSNLWMSSCSHLTIRKTLLRLSSFTPFHGQVSLWYYKTLILFMENVTGRKVFLNFGAFIEDALTFEDKALCSIWAPRVLGFQRMLGHRIFLKESMVVIATAIRLKDPTFLANWIRAMLYRMSFWKYRLLFRYLRFVLRHLINYSFAHFQIRGIKLQLKGKISVAGNARTRTLVQRVGDTSHSKMSNRVAYDLSFVNSFTGVMGFKLWFFY